MDRNSKIYVAGHKGLVGSALWKDLLLKGYNNLIGRSFEELDLRNGSAVENFFIKEMPDYVFLAAAKVGGIVANNTYRADFIYDNLMIQNNIIHSSWKHKVKKLLFLGSSCIYPVNAPQPMKEEYILTGPLEQTNEPYAIAKIAGLKMCESYNRQYGTEFIAVMPTNLYGPSDNFDLEKSHVLPAILRKLHLASSLEKGDLKAIRSDLNKKPIEGIDGNSDPEKILSVLEKYGISVIDNTLRSSLISQISPCTAFGLQGKPLKSHLSDLTSHLSNLISQPVSVTLWGTGTPLREFMYSEEMAYACVQIMENVTTGDIIKLHGGKQDAPQFVNIGTGIEITIHDLAYIIKEITGFKGDILFDSTKPDGPMRKLTDISALKKLGFQSKIGLDKGIRRMYENYLKP